MNRLPNQTGFSNGWRLSNWYSTLRSARFALAAFAIPLTLRTIPEIVAGPYPIGWDIMAFYVPNTLDWAAGRMNVWSMITSPPVMYVIVVPIYLLTKVGLFLTFKVMGPILFGGLAWSIFRFCRKKLFWREKKSLFGVLFMSAYFVVLRISWDAYQLELGLILFVLSLSMGQTTQTVKSGIVQALWLCLVVLSNQLTGVLAVGSGLFFVLRGSKDGLARRALVQLPSVALFLLVLYATFQTPLGSGLGVVGTNLAPFNLVYNIAFLSYAYLLMIPVIVLGRGLFAKPVFSPWLLVCGGGLLLSALPGHVFQDIGYRWVLMLSIPLLLVAYEGYTRLKILETNINIKRWIRLARLFMVVGLAGSAALYIGLPSQLASSFYTVFPQYIPTSMIQSTVPLSDLPYVVSAMVWLNSSLKANSTLITHRAFYGWARFYLSPDKRVIDSFLSSPTSSIGEVDTNAHILTVWWVQGAGWYADAFPVGWKLLRTFGDIAVYQYR